MPGERIDKQISSGAIVHLPRNPNEINRQEKQRNRRLGVLFGACLAIVGLGAGVSWLNQREAKVAGQVQAERDNQKIDTNLLQIRRPTQTNQPDLSKLPKIKFGTVLEDSDPFKDPVASFGAPITFEIEKDKIPQETTVSITIPQEYYSTKSANPTELAQQKQALKQFIESEIARQIETPIKSPFGNETLANRASKHLSRTDSIVTNVKITGRSSPEWAKDTDGKLPINTINPGNINLAFNRATQVNSILGKYPNKPSFSIDGIEVALTTVEQTHLELYGRSQNFTGSKDEIINQVAVLINSGAQVPGSIRKILTSRRDVIVTVTLQKNPLEVDIVAVPLLPLALLGLLFIKPKKRSSRISPIRNSSPTLPLTTPAPVLVAERQSKPKRIFWMLDDEKTIKAMDSGSGDKFIPDKIRVRSQIDDGLNLEKIVLRTGELIRERLIKPKMSKEEFERQSQSYYHQSIIQEVANLIEKQFVEYTLKRKNQSIHPETDPNFVIAYNGNAEVTMPLNYFTNFHAPQYSRQLATCIYKQVWNTMHNNPLFSLQKSTNSDAKKAVRSFQQNKIQI